MADHPRRQSRMSTERRAELFSRVRELLSDVGYERLTFDAVASRARTSKATLYRQWGNKSGLVLAALTRGDARHPPLIQDVDVTSLDDAFAKLAQSERMSERDLRMGLMLLNAASTDPDFASGLRREIIAPVLDELAAVFDAAAERGEIVRDPPLFRRLARLILTDLAFSTLIDDQEESQSAREELFRTVIRPVLDFRGDNNSPSI